ncbi:butyryl-CoA dehydrogenase [Catenulispora sp. EB89]|uniref:acyl-CoA dehydrogenase family protein n=1 Tax=Catenulispora sp. EB89 TaxID=3156257 RepID=UPI0035190FF8
MTAVALRASTGRTDVDISLSRRQVEIGERFAALLSADLAPAVRRMAEQPVPPQADTDEDAAYTREAVWRALVELGATRLLLPERYDGEQAGQQGAVVVAELLGRVLYQGPLLDTMTATEVMLAEADPAGKLLREIAEGAAVTVAVRRGGRDSHSRPAKFDCPDQPGGPTVEAERRFVGFAPETWSVLLVGRVGQVGPAVHAALVPRDHPTVTWRRHDDIGRGELYAVRFAGSPVAAWFGDPDGGCAAWPQIVARARIRHAAYLVGLSQGALDLAVDRASARRQFGRPIGRFQALAFQLAGLATRLEGARLLVRAAAWEADEGRDPRLSAAQALGMAADLAGEITAAAVQVHGAYGMTEDCDVQIYYRRAHVERGWLGAAADVRAEAVPWLAEAVRARHSGRPDAGGRL